MHKCRDSCYINRESENIKSRYEFPFEVHLELNPTICPQSQCWLYFRPTLEHQNVVPYHAAILLLWQAHMNIQKVTDTGLSYYLLKYAMKTEPIGKLRLEPTNTIGFGLNSIDPTKLKLISTYLLSKPTSPTELAITCLKISIIERSDEVTCIDSSPPSMRQIVISRFMTPKLHPIDMYIARPIQLENFTFADYWKKFIVEKNKHYSTKLYYKDLFGNFVQECNRVIIFIDYHPAHHFKAFFYNVLLQNIPFQNENELLSINNLYKSYFIECCERNIINIENDIDSLVDDYYKLHFLIDETKHQLTNMILQQNPTQKIETKDLYDDDETITKHILDERYAMVEMLKEFNELQNKTLTNEQQQIYN